MTLAELSYDTGLPLDLARLAKKREHGEPFRILEGNRMHILSAIKQEGLCLTRGGRYFHLTDGCDKGKAVKVLKTLYSEMFGKVLTYAVGDGPNDYPMLKAVDNPFIIKKSPTSRLNAWRGILSHLTSTICP
jgi:mannosyl-3-phosphoglycerate phosphatase